jgi:hypothetical protein
VSMKQIFSITDLFAIGIGRPRPSNVHPVLVTRHLPPTRSNVDS